MISNLLIKLLSHMPLYGQGLLFIFAVGAVAFPAAKIFFFMMSINKSLQKEREAKKLAIDKRKAPANGPQVFVRQTDILEKMSKEDQAQYNLAMQLIEKKQIIEAANILEAIKFQRKAIDILENTGFIEEAAQMLFRLSAPNRAAVLYERNKMFDKALAVYLKLNMHKEAGFTYLKLGPLDFRYVYMGAQCFEKSSLLKEAFESYMSISAFKEAFSLAPQLFDHEIILQSYLRDRIAAQYFLSTSSLETIENFIKKIKFLPLDLNSLLEWIRLAPDKLPYAYIFPEILKGKGLFAYLLHRSDPLLKKIILQKMFTHSDLLLKYTDTIIHDLETSGCRGEAIISALVFEKTDEAIKSLSQLSNFGVLADTLHQFPLFKNIILSVPGERDEISMRKWLEEIKKDILTVVKTKKTWSEQEKKAASVRAQPKIVA